MRVSRLTRSAAKAEPIIPTQISRKMPHPLNLEVRWERACLKVLLVSDSVSIITPPIPVFET
jgi:hypothetical protein